MFTFTDTLGNKWKECCPLLGGNPVLFLSPGPISAFRQPSGVARQQKKGNIPSFFFTPSPVTAGVMSTHQSVGPTALTTTFTEDTLTSAADRLGEPRLPALAVECLLRVLTKRPRFFIIIALNCPFFHMALGLT